MKLKNVQKRPKTFKSSEMKRKSYNNKLKS